MKERNAIFDNMRGICMLGVIAIHVGDLVMESGTPWNWLYLLCEVLSRYSVPTFFFISGYGLFYSHPLEKELDYLHFIKKRLKSIGIPYIIASFFYMFVASLMARDPGMWHPKHILFVLIFGLGNYHIYFLVILLWFYLLIPLWRHLMAGMEKIGITFSMAVLFILQLLLYRASAHFWAYPQWVVDHHWIYDLLQFRLNYFPFFYLFVFMLGGVVARHYNKFLLLIQSKRKILGIFFLASAAFNTIKFYRWVLLYHMSLEDTTNALQQLSTPGLIYTLASILFFSSLLERFPAGSLPVLERISERSFLIYLIHPFFLDQLYYYINLFLMPFQQFPMPLFYLLLLLISYLVSEALHHIIQKAKTSGYLP
jgi:surface polysaccharide O-acyltransferase-like enzyme